MTWYKATRIDGTSFADGKTLWEVGQTVKLAPPDRGSTLCARGLLHISDAPGETLIGGRWPCRLFRVRPNKIVAQEGHKAGCWSVAVYQEMDAWRALGPNGKEVSALIERSRRLTPTEGESLGAAWDAARDAALGAAWGAAWGAAALTVKDLISPDQFNLLYGPWRSVIDV